VRKIKKIFEKKQGRVFRSLFFKNYLGFLRKKNFLAPSFGKKDEKSIFRKKKKLEDAS